MTSPPPEAEGSLAETPFAHLLLYLYRQAGNGTLRVLTPEGAEIWVRFRRGRPVAARSEERASTIEEALLPPCKLTDGSFQFYASDLMRDGGPVLTGMVDPYALLYASMTDHARDDMVHAVLARYPNVRLALPPQRDLGRLRLRDEDQDLVHQLRAGPCTVDELVSRSKLPELQAKRLVYTLLVTHMVAPDEDRSGNLYRSQVVPEEEAAAAHAQIAGAEQAPADTATRKHDRSAPSVTSIEIPGPPATPTDATTTARARGSVNEIASASMPAWQRLISMRPPDGGQSKPPASAGAIASLRPPSTLRRSGAGTGQGIAAAVNDPATRRKRAEQFMHTARFAEALTLLEDLANELPNDAALHGMHARALFEVHRADAAGLPRTVLDAVRRAHKIDPDEIHAYFTKGLVYKQGGELNKAVSCWKRVLMENPRHIDAQRELRLARLRGF